MIHQTAIHLGEKANNFIAEEIKTGRFSTPSEVVQAALLLMENQETAKRKLVGELEAGEDSGFVEHFDRHRFLENLHLRSKKDAI